MEEECGSSHSPLSSATSSDVEPTTTTTGEEVTVSADDRLRGLFEKYNMQEKELSRLEQQNNEYRDQLIRTIRERDLNAELLKNVRGEQAGKMEELERKVVTLESQLNVARDRATAQEAHYTSTTRDLTNKFNASVQQLTKKADLSEKEKNEAVIKYAMREAEVMRINADLVKKDDELKTLREECEQLRNSTEQENLSKLERSNEEQLVEIEKLKCERLDLDNRLKVAEKRIEVGQSALADSKQQMEVLRKQMFQLKEDKATVQDEHRALLQRVQADEERNQVCSSEQQKLQTEREELYKQTASQAARVLEQQLAEERRANQLQSQLSTAESRVEQLENELEEERRTREGREAELRRLQDIEQHVKSCEESAAASRLTAEDATRDKETAEAEAEACRKQAEHMLAINEQLSERSSQLAGECEQLRDQNAKLESDVRDATTSLQHARQEVDDVKAELSAAAAAARVVETPSVSQQQHDESVRRVSELEKALDEARSEHAVYRKKQASTVKELKLELANLRRERTADKYLEPIRGEPSEEASSVIASTTSRASSVLSIDQVGKERPETSQSEESKGERGGEKAQPQATAVDDPAHVSVNQAILDKVVKLQRQLARRTEKIEFLEEHVRQCLEELQKKTKIIQYYALREEASLLMPAGSVDEVPLARRGTSYSLMGSFFTNDKKGSLQLATEVNSRLQAVLEDTLHKNIALKASVDKLGDEVSRLSRENRQLTLMKR